MCFQKLLSQVPPLCKWAGKLWKYRLTEFTQSDPGQMYLSTFEKYLHFKYYALMKFSSNNRNIIHLNYLFDCNKILWK